MVSGREFFASWRAVLRPPPSWRWDRSELMLLPVSSQLSAKQQHRRLITLTSSQVHLHWRHLLLSNCSHYPQHATPPTPVISRGRHSDFGLSVWSYTRSLWTRYLAPNLQFICSLRQRRTDYISWSKVTTSIKNHLLKYASFRRRHTAR